MTIKPLRSAEPLSVPIDEAAKMLGMSRAQFYRLFLNTGRLQTVPKGRRGRMVDMAELRRAYRRFVSETRRKESK